MQMTIEELFNDSEYKQIVKDKWKTQFKKNGKLQSNTKMAIINELLKHYDSAEYIKGSKKYKACFEIGDKRDSKLNKADMIASGYYKAGAGNIKSHNVIAFKIFKNYLNQLKDKETVTMTRMNWVQKSGITSIISDLNNIDNLDIDNAFKNYYKDDLASSLKNVLSFCLKQLNVNEVDATVYYCDCYYDEDADIDDNGNAKRLMADDEVKAMKEYVSKLKEKYAVNKFQFASDEFKSKLRNWYKNNLKSKSIWIEIELNVSDLAIEQNDLSINELEELRKQFIIEFQKYRNNLYINREFKRKVKGEKGLQWRHTADLLQDKRSTKAPYKQMEERNYFKLMTKMDEMIGFGEADWAEYKAMEAEYNKSKNDDMKLVEDLYRQFDNAFIANTTDVVEQVEEEIYINEAIVI